MSTDCDKKVRSIPQAGYDIKCTAEITTHATRAQTLEANITKAFSLILTNSCTTGMCQRLGKHPDWKTKIEDHPLYLLETLTSLAFKSTSRTALVSDQCLCFVKQHSSDADQCPKLHWLVTAR